MNERDTSPIGFFQKYLTVWVILCMAVGICIGKFLPQIPEFLNRFEYARVSIPMAILIWVMIQMLSCLCEGWLGFALLFSPSPSLC